MLDVVATEDAETAEVSLGPMRVRWLLAVATIHPGVAQDAALMARTLDFREETPDS